MKKEKDAIDGPSPYDSASFFSWLTFSYTNALLKQGYRSDLTPADIWPCGSQRCVVVGKEFTRSWEEEVANKGHEGASLFRAICKTFTHELIRDSIISVLWAIFLVVGPAFIFPSLLLYLQDPTWKVYVGWILCFALVASLVVTNFLAPILLWCAAMFAGRVRSALTYAIITRTSLAAEPPSSLIINVLSNDLQRIYMAATFGSLTLGSLVAVLGVGASLLARFQLAGMPPFVMLLCVYPVTQVIGRFAAKRSAKLLPVTDKRVKLMAQIIHAIRTLKLNAWEETFSDMVDSIRKMELRQRFLAAVVGLLSEASVWVFVQMANMLFLLVWTLTNRPFLPSDVYTGLALIACTRVPLIQVQMIAQFFGEARLSMQRVKKILLLKLAPPSSTKIALGAGESAEINVVDAQVRQGDFTLRNLNFKCPSRSVTFICGPVGAGKSTLALGLISALPDITGQFHVRGDCAFVPQEAFIMSASLRDNILFGLPFDEERYNRVIYSCCLDADLKQLVDGDLTEIGSFGINLSGGQRQRVSLARAAYACKNIVVLDDCLSALDANVGKTVFERLIQGFFVKEQGALVVIVSHQLQYAQQCDSVVVLKDGEMVQRGTYNDLMREDGGVFFNMMQDYLASEEKAGQEEAAEAEEELKLERLVPIVSNSSHEKAPPSVASADNTAAMKTYQLIKTEQMSSGRIDRRVWLKWLEGFSGMIFVVLACSLICYGAVAYTDFLLASWTSLSYGWASTTYLIVYCCLCLTSCVALLCYLTLWWKLALRSARRLHDLCFRALMKAKISWFESVPQGRILNRFTKDVDVLDQQLPDSFKVFVGNSLQLLSFVIVIAVAFPYFLIAIGPIVVAFVAVSNYYKTSATQLRRVEGVVRSPVFANSSLIISGLKTIKCFGQTDDFLNRLFQDFDRFHSCIAMFTSATRWLSLRLDLICTSTVFVAAVISVSTKGAFSAASAGIAITYSMRFGSFLQWTFRNLTILESSMTSAERIVEYAEDIPCETENPIVEGQEDRLADWPSNGRVEFENVCARYDSGLPLVLSGVTFTAEARESVGIVGRTGAGKSTLTSLLFRLREVESGVIRVDGVDISRIPLAMLRSRLAIVSQEAILFNGTLRFNLDPSNKMTDEELWDVLQRVGMADYAEANGGLECVIESNGDNLSAGERQLLCIARALLKHARVLILDEATANIDTKADAEVQRVLRTAFKNCTTLIIAHRLNTIVDSSRILVLDRGTVKEYGTPAALVAKKSVFRDLILDTGKTSRRLLQIASSSSSAGRPFARGQSSAESSLLYPNDFSEEFELFATTI